MKQLIIPIFVMNRGCPNRCVFCNERIAAGDYPDFITEEYFRNTVDAHLKSAGNRYDEVQIAFYGGNFTGMDESYQETLLEYARPYIEEGPVDSIRISTRPDYIDEACLEYIRNRYVQTVEIGGQSLNDDVLASSKRGHSAGDVKRATALLKNKGFKAGVHLMVGLPGDTRKRFLDTVDEVVSLKPHMVRIHPTIVFRDTELEKMYREGVYEPPSLDDAVEWCKQALLRLKKARINVIRLGLHTSVEMTGDGNIVTGPFHPAFRTLVESALFLDMTSALLYKAQVEDKAVSLIISPHDASYLRGFRNGNIDILRKRFPDTEISILNDPNRERETLSLAIIGTGKMFTASINDVSY